MALWTFESWKMLLNIADDKQSKCGGGGWKIYIHIFADLCNLHARRYLVEEM